MCQLSGNCRERAVQLSLCIAEMAEGTPRVGAGQLGAHSGSPGCGAHSCCRTPRGHRRHDDVSAPIHRDATEDQTYKHLLSADGTWQGARCCLSWPWQSDELHAAGWPPGTGRQCSEGPGLLSAAFPAASAGCWIRSGGQAGLDHFQVWSPGELSS